MKSQTKSKANLCSYNPDTHEYGINGITIPHITDLIPGQKFVEWMKIYSPDTLEQWRNDGKENHSLIKLYYDTNKTYNDPMLKALDRWVLKNKSVLGDLVLNEKPLYSVKHLFGGTPDSIFTKAIVDYKRSPGDSKHHALQISGQHILAVENKYIKKTKTWLIAWYDKKADEFKSRNVYRAQAEGVFINLIKEFYINQSIQNYLKGV